MQVVSLSDIFFKGAPIAAGVPFDASARDVELLGGAVRPATEEEIAANDGIDATDAANVAADRRNSGTASISTETRETAAVVKPSKSKAKAKTGASTP